MAPLCNWWGWRAQPRWWEIMMDSYACVSILGTAGRCLLEWHQRRLDILEPIMWWVGAIKIWVISGTTVVLSSYCHLRNGYGSCIFIVINLVFMECSRALVPRTGWEEGRAQLKVWKTRDEGQAVRTRLLGLGWKHNQNLRRSGLRKWDVWQKYDNIVKLNSKINRNREARSSTNNKLVLQGHKKLATSCYISKLAPDLGYKINAGFPGPPGSVIEF